MELFVISSAYSKVPLAEIRTDGSNIDWVLDNTKGKLPAIAGGQFAKLKMMVDKSHHLTMSTPDQATVGILRYSLVNGDVVEITTDGKTALLNGKIMAEEEKLGLMAAINAGKIQVKNKADIQRPIPITPRPKPYKKEASGVSIDKHIHEAIAKSKEEDIIKELDNNRFRDSRIDSVDFSGTHSPEMGRQLLYLLKYGEGDA